MVLVVTGIIATMSIKVSNDPTGIGTAKKAHFFLDDATGLVKNSNVRMAGIPIGTIQDIVLDKGSARVEVVLKANTPLTQSSRIEIRPNGILGDKFVEIVAGDPKDPPLQSGEQIMIVDDRASVDKVIAEVSKITKSLSQVAENIRTATEGDKEKPIGRIIDNVEKITTDLADLTKKNKGDVSEILSNLRETTATINDMVNDDSRDGFKAAWTDALKSLRKIEGTLTNVEQITGKINRGEGTIGKLVNDDSTVEELNSAITGINNMLDASSKLQTGFDYHTNYITAGKFAKSFLSVRAQPGIDRFYELGIVDDPDGTLERTVTSDTSNGTTTTTSEDKRFTKRVRFNALFGKNFWNLTLKGGIIENSGGFGVEYALLRKRLKLGVDFYDFSGLQVRASARYNIWSGFYLTAGGEDLLNKLGRSGLFVGGGLYLTNDDLKLLLTRLPF